MPPHPLARLINQGRATSQDRPFLQIASEVCCHVTGGGISIHRIFGDRFQNNRFQFNRNASIQLFGKTGFFVENLLQQGCAILAIKNRL